MTSHPSLSYAKGTLFGSFMRRAFPKKAGNLPGMNGDEFRNLIDAENGESWVRHLGSAEKQLVNVKKLMHKAMEAYLVNKNLHGGILPAIKHLKEQIDESRESSYLHEIVMQTMDVTQDLLDA